MIKDTLAKIEARLKDPSSLNEINKKELQQLFLNLKQEVTDLSEIHGEHSEFATLKNLSSSIEEFEISHPQLIAILNNISNALSNMGI